METLILASQSPRRQEILREMGILFDVLPSRYEEDNGRAVPPETLVRIQAEGKARETAARTGGGRLVLAADTVVVLAGKVLGKPRDAADAARMLAALSGKTHLVMTGMALVRGRWIKSGTEVTEVTFRTLSKEDIDRYIRTGEPMDKAGAYAIQGIGGQFVTGIRGSRSNVIGLPKQRVLAFLEAAEKEAGHEDFRDG